jgi:hypothetical protein
MPVLKETTSAFYKQLRDQREVEDKGEKATWPTKISDGHGGCRDPAIHGQ